MKILRLEAPRRPADPAPSPWPLAIGITLAIVLVSWLSQKMTFSFGLVKAGLNPAMILAAAPAVLAVLMTRRSPLPVTIGAAALAMLLQQSLPFFGVPSIPSALAAGLATWISATKSPLPPEGQRRPVGGYMPSRYWMPLMALAIMAYLFINSVVRSINGQPMDMGASMIMMLMYVIFSAWVAAFTMDRLGAAVARDAQRRECSTAEPA